MANYIDDTELSKQILEDKKYYVYKLYPNGKTYDTSKFSTKEKEIKVQKIFEYGKEYYKIYFENENLFCTPYGFQELDLYYNDEILVPEAKFRLLASEKLASYFMLIEERILSKGNWRGYTNEYKNELRSMGSLFFARYWWKYNPLRVNKNKLEENHNYNEDDDVLYGAFTYFTNLISSAFLGGISDINKSKKLLKEKDSKIEHSEDDINSIIYSGRFENEGFYI